MQFEIKSKDKDGNVQFTGTANQKQASFLFEIGVNWLLSRGAEPLLTEELVAATPEQRQ